MVEPRLNRSLRTRDLVVHGLAAMVPISVWGLFGEVHEAGDGHVALVYAMGLACMLLTAVSYAAMSREVPAAGSVYSYAKSTLGPLAGFLGGWMILLDYLLLPTLLYVFAAESMHALVPAVDRALWGLAFVALNLVVGLSGISRMTFVLRVIVLVEVGFIGYFLCAAGLALAGNPALLSASAAPAQPSFSVVAGALSIAILSYLGFDAVSTLAEETRLDARRQRVGRAMFIALVITGALLIAQSALASAFSGGLLVNGHFPESVRGTAFFEVVGRVISSDAMRAFLVVNVIATGVANAVTAHTAAARVLFSMARDRRMPGILARIDLRGVPRAAVVGIALLSAALVVAFAGELSLISSLVNVGALCGYIAVHIAVIVRAGRRRSAAWMLRALSAAAGIALLGAVLWNASWQAKLVGAVWLLAGVVAAEFTRRRARSDTNDRGLLSQAVAE